MAVTIQRNQDRNKTLVEALSKVYGLGRQKICYAARLAGIYPFRKVSSIPERVLRMVERTLSEQRTGRYLKQQRQERIRFLLSIGTYRALRMSQGLPSRGQRSHTNAQTAKKLGRVKNLYFKVDQARGSRIEGRSAVFDFRKARSRSFGRRFFRKKHRRYSKRRK
jgi:small subunit ribosomal protein S13